MIQFEAAYKTGCSASAFKMLIIDLFHPTQVKIGTKMFAPVTPLPANDAHACPDAADMKFEFFGRDLGEYLPGDNQGRFVCVDSLTLGR